MAKIIGTGTGTGSGSGGVGELAAAARENPELVEMFKKDPVKALETFALANPLRTDKVLYRLVVGSLGAAVLISLIGAIVLAPFAKETPQVLVAIGSAAVGALAGLLAPSPTQG